MISGAPRVLLLLLLLAVPLQDGAHAFRAKVKLQHELLKKWLEAKVVLPQRASNQQQFGAEAGEDVVSRKEDKVGPETIVAESYAVNQEQPQFPGRHAQVKTGIAFSGGGCRAFSNTMGSLRALEALGVVGQVDAISSVSGGTWASSIFMFAEMETSALLGAATDPKMLTREALWGQNGAFSDSVDFERLFKILASQGLPETATLAAETILKPFGLSDVDAMLASSKEKVEKIREANPALASRHFLTPRPDRPKVYIMNGVISQPLGDAPDKKNFVSLQMSPDYTGSPFWAKRSATGSIEDFKWERLSGDENQGLVLGGGLIDTYAFGSKAPEEGGQSGGEVRVEVPKMPLSLSAIVAIGTSILWVPSLNEYWPLLPEGQKQAAQMMTLIDAGHYENAGLLPLLQRGAERVAFFMSSGNALNMQFDYCSPPPNTEWDNVFTNCSMNDCTMSGFFGFGYDVDYFDYKHDQVFDREEFLPLICEFQTLQREGKPSVLKKQYTLKDNAWWGIKGGRTVTLVISYLQRAADFEALLPKETQEEVLRGRTYGNDWTTPFRDFPNIPTIAHLDPLWLSRPEVNLLAAQAEYSVLQNAALYRELLV